MAAKSASITGAGSGIGQATSICLEKAGYRIIICGRSESMLIESPERLANPDGGFSP